mgnify:CR=1 FL=1
MSSRRPALFLDKDGTLVHDVPYNVDPGKIALAEGAGPALARVAAQGFALVVVTNQSGVARGYFAEDALHRVHGRLAALLRPHRVELSGFYWCPHHPEGTVPTFARECACRKPGPGLLHRAAAELGLDLQRSWMIGDILNDVEAGCRAGCRTILLDSGGETEWLPGSCRTPDHTVTGWELVPDLLTGKRETAVRGTGSGEMRPGIN